MKTWTAALLHIGVSAAQTAAGVTYFDNAHPSGMMANTGIQLGLQVALLAMQAYITKKNSNSAPDGQKLTQTINGGYVSAPVPEKK